MAPDGDLTFRVGVPHEAHFPLFQCVLLVVDVAAHGLEQELNLFQQFRWKAGMAQRGFLQVAQVGAERLAGNGVLRHDGRADIFAVVPLVDHQAQGVPALLFNFALLGPFAFGPPFALLAVIVSAHFIPPGNAPQAGSIPAYGTAGPSSCLLEVRQVVEVALLRDVGADDALHVVARPAADEPVPLLRDRRVHLVAPAVRDDEDRLRVAPVVLARLFHFLLDKLLQNVEGSAAAPVDLLGGQGGFLDHGIEAEQANVEAVFRQALGSLEEAVLQPPAGAGRVEEEVDLDAVLLFVDLLDLHLRGQEHILGQHGEAAVESRPLLTVPAVINHVLPCPLLDDLLPLLLLFDLLRLDEVPLPAGAGAGLLLLLLEVLVDDGLERFLLLSAQALVQPVDDFGEVAVVHQAVVVHGAQAVAGLRLAVARLALAAGADANAGQRDIFKLVDVVFKAVVVRDGTALVRLDMAVRLLEHRVHPAQLVPIADLVAVEAEAAQEHVVDHNIQRDVA